MKTFYCFLLLALPTFTGAQNNILKGKVLFQSSGNKPAVGVRVAEPDANPAYSVDNGEYILTFQKKRNGDLLAIEVGADDRNRQKLELVNEKEVKAAKLPADPEHILDIIVCLAGQRDIAAQKYYRILRTTADRELERKKKEVAALLEQKEKDYQKISDLFAQLDRIQAALDSVKIREQAFNIASINLDRASQMVKDAVKKIDEENDVEGALQILDTEALNIAYQEASMQKKKAETAISQVIEGYELKISLLNPQFRFDEIEKCYEEIINICQIEGVDIEKIAKYYYLLSSTLLKNGKYQKALEKNLHTLSIREFETVKSYKNLFYSYNQAAQINLILDNHKKSIECLEKSLQSFKYINDQDSCDLSSIYSLFAAIYTETNDFQLAHEYNNKAIKLGEKYCILNQMILASLYTTFSEYYRKMGMYDKALALDIRSLDIAKANGSLNLPSLSTAYGNIADDYRNMGEYQKAIEFTNNQLNIAEKIFYSKHPDLAVPYNNLASIYLELGNYNEAIKYYEKSISIIESTLGTKHSDLALYYSNLGVAYEKSNKYDTAIDNYINAVNISISIYGEEHFNCAVLYNNIAESYRYWGKYQESLKYHMKSLEIKRKIFESNHPSIANSYNNMAMTYSNLGDNNKSLEYSLKSLEIRESVFDSMHPYLGQSYSNIALTLSEMRRYDEALIYVNKGLKIRRAKLPFDHPQLVYSQNIFIEIYKQRGIDFYTNKQYKNAISDFDTVLNHVDSGYIYIYRGRCHFGLKNYAEAIADYRKALSLDSLLASAEYYMHIGMAYAKKKEFQLAREFFIRYEKSNTSLSTSWRNWAAFHALKNDKRSAIGSLQRAIALGYNDLEWITTDDSLESIRGEQEYKELVEYLKKR